MRSGEYGTLVPENQSFTSATEPLVGMRTPWKANFYDPFADEYACLLALGFSKPLLYQIKNRARMHGSSMEEELLTSSCVKPAHYYEAIARFLKVPFLPTIPKGAIFDHEKIDSQLANPQMVRIHREGTPPGLLVVPKAKLLNSLLKMITRDPSKRDALIVTTPEAMREAVWQAVHKRRVLETVHHLSESHPVLSAKEVMWGQQGFVFGLLFSVVLFIYLTASEVGFLSLHLILSLVYLSSLLIRLFALTVKNTEPPVPEFPNGPLPVYSVLVPLYQEAAVVPQLISALNALHWPKAKLDIKLICESDDLETISALKTLNLGSHFEIISVPVLAPRTKPKALSYAMSGIRGEFVVVYDAEDIPHPKQLLEAYSGFLHSPPETACLQSPLKIVHFEKTWLGSLFALEYAGLFQVILPVLARFHFPLPLGGTSNHFKVEALRLSGNWDPFNVTEDADLGIRLHRMGFRSRVLTLPTQESAPENWPIWMGQRRRWFKGWMQTLLVHTRQPTKLCNQAGLAAAVAFLLTIGGGLVSALAHPFIIVIAIEGLFPAKSTNNSLFFDTFLFWIDIGNLAASYAVFFTLGRSCLCGSLTKLRIALSVPVYWVAMSIAAWWGLIELFHRPHHWQKTPHSPIRTFPVTN